MLGTLVLPSTTIERAGDEAPVLQMCRIVQVRARDVRDVGASVERGTIRRCHLWRAPWRALLLVERGGPTGWNASRRGGRGRLAVIAPTEVARVKNGDRWWR